MSRTHSISVALFALAVCARPAAQVDVRGAPDVSTANVQFGRLLLNPTLSLTNLGIDTNVFNEPDQLEPKSDFTITVTPKTDLWLRLGRTWLTGHIREDLVWYQDYASERAANNGATVGWLAPLTRLTFTAGAGYLRTRDRPGFEIDARLQRSELAFTGSVDLRVVGKTSVGVRGDRRRTRFDDDARFAGFNLREELNRTVTSAGVTVRHQLTPLTALTFDVGKSQDRFLFSPLRDSDSRTVALGVELDRFALIKGRASVGYRNFQPRTAGVPAFTGTIASADLSYVAFETTQLAVQALRSVEYSFDIAQPYYLLNGLSASLTRRVLRAVDVVGRAGLQRLAYRNRLDLAVAPAERIDRVRSFGGGVGFHPGDDTRVGFDVARQRRASPAAGRVYHGFTFGTSVTYGF